MWDATGGARGRADCRAHENASPAASAQHGRGIRRILNLALAVGCPLILRQSFQICCHATLRVCGVKVLLRGCSVAASQRRSVTAESHTRWIPVGDIQFAVFLGMVTDQAFFGVPPARPRRKGWVCGRVIYAHSPGCYPDVHSR